MPGASTYQTGKGEFDGALPIVINSPAMALDSAATHQAPFVMPCNGEIVQATVNLIQAPAGAAAALQFGTRADATAFESYSIATSHATGALDIPLSGFAETDVSKGDVVEFSTDGSATASGIVAATLVIMPRGAN